MIYIKFSLPIIVASSFTMFLTELSGYAAITVIIVFNYYLTNEMKCAQLCIEGVVVDDDFLDISNDFTQSFDTD